MISLAFVGRIRERPGRAALSVVGILVGAATITTFGHLTRCVEIATLQRLEQLGANTMFVTQHSRGVSGASKLAKPLTAEDAAALRQSVHALDSVGTLIRFSAPMTVCGITRWVSVVGVDPDYGLIETRGVRAGRFISHLDVVEKNAVFVSGASLSNTWPCLHGSGDRFARFQFGYFRHVGVLDSLGFDASGDLDALAYVPSSVAEQKVALGSRQPIALVLKAAPGSDLDFVERAVEDELRRRHHLEDGDKNDFLIARQTAIAGSAKAAIASLTGFVVFIASWGLLIATVGILNTVFTSVIERTSEIGLKRAVGANRATIRREYLSEGLGLAVAGAVLGIAVGFALVPPLAWIFELPIGFRLDLAAGTLLACALLGLLAGYWPANRAAGISPHDALRYE